MVWGHPGLAAVTQLLERQESISWGNSQSSCLALKLNPTQVATWALGRSGSCNWWETCRLMSRELKWLAQGHGESAGAGSGSKAWSWALHSSLGHLMQSDPWKLLFLLVSLRSFGPFRSWDKFSITENKFGCALENSRSESRLVIYRKASL